MTKAEGESSSSSSKLDPFVKWIAVGVTIAFVVLFVYMMRIADTENETHWARLTYLFGAAEAIAFAAVGALFGREVNRSRAENAESAAREAGERATTAQEAAVAASERGKALAAAVKVQGPGAARKRKGDLMAGTEDAERKGEDPLESLRALADELFPEGEG